jgi:hypothetical protein
MKITKDYIKQVIQEEIQNLQELKPNPQLEGSVHQTYYYNDEQKKYFMISTKKDYASGVARGAFKFCNVLFQILENDIEEIDSRYSGCHESQDYAIADHKRARKAFINEGARVLSREQIIKIFPSNTAISVPSLPQNTAMKESSMKITKTYLKQIIKEEYNRLLMKEGSSSLEGIYKWGESYFYMTSGGQIVGASRNADNTSLVVGFSDIADAEKLATGQDKASRPVMSRKQQISISGELTKVNINNPALR